jgi:hypothetical protein
VNGIVLIPDPANNLCVRGAHVGFAVLGDHMARFHESMHEEKVLLVAVTRRVEVEDVIREHARTLEVQIIDHRRDRAGIADNRVARENHRIPILNGNIAVRSHPDTGK